MLPDEELQPLVSSPTAREHWAESREGRSGCTPHPGEACGSHPEVLQRQRAEDQDKNLPVPVSTSLHAAGVTLLQTSPGGAVPRAGLEQDAAHIGRVGEAEQHRPHPSCSSRSRIWPRGCRAGAGPAPGSASTQLLVGRAREEVLFFFSFHDRAEQIIHSG